jgi:uncharacterized protein (TIGR03000 family)
MPAYSYCHGCYGCCGGVVVSPAPAVANPAPAGARAAMPPTTVDPGVMPRTDAEREAVLRLLKDMRKAQPAPAPRKQPQDEVSTPAPAKVTVKVPADARLWVDQVECPLTSGERTFDTPALQPGQTYFYTLKMQRQGAQSAETQRVVMRAGQHVTVTFGSTPTLATAQR